MIESIPAACSFLSLYTGWAMLASAQHRHWRTLTGTSTEPPIGASLLGFRLVAAALLLTGLCLCIKAAGLSFGFVLWVAQLFASAAMVAFTLAWKPSVLKPSARLLATLETTLTHYGAPKVSDTTTQRDGRARG